MEKEVWPRLSATGNGGTLAMRTTMLWTAVALWAAALPADDGKQPKKPAAPPTLDELWEDLAKEEVPASRALLQMADRKDDLVPFLRKRLKPLTITAARVRELVKDLGDKNDAVATEAYEALEYFDPRLAIEYSLVFRCLTARPADAEVPSGNESTSAEPALHQLAIAIEIAEACFPTLRADMAADADAGHDRLQSLSDDS